MQTFANRKGFDVTWIADEVSIRMVRGKNKRRRKLAQSKSKAVKRKPARTAAEDSNTPVLDATKLRALYAALLQCRRLGEKLAVLARQGKIPHHSSAPVGREAAIVGTVLHLLPQDMIAPSPSLFLASHLLGAPTDLILEYLTGESLTGAHVSGNHAAPAVDDKAHLGAADHLHAAVRAALSIKMQQKAAVVLAVVDEDVSAPSFWHDAANFAGVHRLPVVFVICTSPEQPTLRHKALTFGVPGITVDGHDVVAVFRVAQESVRRAREGHGPTLIECKMMPADADREGSGDSVTFMEAYLAKRKLWTRAWKQGLLKQFARE